nr:MAG TPA: hypothetical protein [Caudoviricetes sp.]
MKTLPNMKGATMNNNTKYNLNFFSMDDSFHTKIL